MVSKLANAEAVRVYAGAEQSHDGVSRFDPGAIDYLVSIHDADSEAGHIVASVGKSARVFGRLAAEQHASSLAAACGDAGDNGRCDINVQLAGGNIIAEK